MPTNNKNATALKERLTYALVGHIFLIMVSVLALILYILPKLETINKKTQETNESIHTYEDTYENGISTEKILSLTQKNVRKQDFHILVKNNKKAVTQVIKKNGPQKKYLDWLNEELKNSDEDMKKLQIIKAKMNSIIPTLSPAWKIIDEKHTSLKDYVTFIENELLSKYNVKSDSPISIEKVTYAKDTKNSPMGNIGFIDISLQFEGTNKNIYDFLDSIYKFGNTEILTQTGRVITSIDEVPAVMSNPLVTVESLTLNNEINIDTDKTKEFENAGTIILRFYVRGSSHSDALFLANEVKLRKQKLKKEVTSLIELCEKEKIPCDQSTQEKLGAFDAKYSEFLRMAQSGKIGKTTSTSTISQLAEQIQTLRTFNDEFTTVFQILINAKKSLKTEVNIPKK